MSDNANSQLFTAQDAALFSLHKMPAVVLIFCILLSPFFRSCFLYPKLNKGVSDSIYSLHSFNMQDTKEILKELQKALTIPISAENGLFGKARQQF